MKNKNSKVAFIGVLICHDDDILSEIQKEIHSFEPTIAMEGGLGRYDIALPINSKSALDLHRIFESLTEYAKKITSSWESVYFTIYDENSLQYIHYSSSD